MELLINAVEKHKQLILDAERYIWKNPETGWKEFKTSAYMAEQFEKLGYTLTYSEGTTGFFTVLDTGRPGPEVLILGELDSIICPEHPEADPNTGAVHSCGHNAQCATLLGIAAALKEKGALDELCGRIRLCAVPAEELLEIEYRRELKRKGIIKYFGGKVEFLHRGYFDGVDIAFMVHTSDSYAVGKNSVGCIAKNIIYKGTASHAGGAPWAGCNALYAATCGLNAANALRETFKESDFIRFHPIITRGGDMVNAIPEVVQAESYVRGISFEAIEHANKKINRALAGAALSMGANVEIVDIPGYAPLINSEPFTQLAAKAAEIAIPNQQINTERYVSTGSTDMGDISCIMPTIHPYAGGAQGKGHGNDYYIVDPAAACVDNAKWQLGILFLLLKDNAAQANQIISDFTPRFASKEEYLAYVDRFNSSGDRIQYNENGTATVTL